MHPDLAALIARHAPSPELAAELEALVERLDPRPSLATTVVEGYESVDVERTFLAEDASLDEAPKTDTAEVPRLAGRYEDLGLIGTGGMGEVRRVRDVELNRTLAMKIVSPELLGHPVALARFLEEAQATAQLQHPNIVPVHDIGTLSDGRLWFTMKEVRGQTLTAVVGRVHQASGFRWETTVDGWTFRRVVASFLATCHAMAYAHERGVVHRDLKPANIMVGTRGETYVLDWGLAKLVGRAEAGQAPVPGAEAQRTMAGTITGTPAYMSPEQARGGDIDARSDVYALGAVLYQILCGEPPFRGSVEQVLASVRAGSPVPVEERARERGGPPLPQELVAACTRAMAHDPATRFGSALALALEIEAWLDGARKRDQAAGITERALDGVRRAEAMRRQATALAREGEALLAEVATWAPEAAKAAGWKLQDAAAGLLRAAELEQLQVDQGLHGALRVAPDLPQAHAALAERYRRRHATAESVRDEEAAQRAEQLLRAHVEALPETHRTRRECAAYLRGDGALTLITEPAGASVRLYRYVPRNRRLVEEPERTLGRTPLREVALPMGSYLCLVEHPDCAPVRYPFEVPRLGHWDGVAPGDSESTPIRLPPKQALGPGEVYVPPGWFRSGGDARATGAHPARRLWAEGFAIQRFAVTNREYLAFLDALVADGRTEEALAAVPRLAPSVEGTQGAMSYGFDGQRFSLVVDAEGDRWLPEWPVVNIDWFGARAYLAWLAERTGKPWRLAAELEWEKAARGVDGRWYPWGDFADPSWACCVDSHPGQALPQPVDSFPVDTSPFGVRGVGGNVRTWCVDLFEGEPSVEGDRVRVGDMHIDAPLRAHRVARGGAWSFSSGSVRSGYRSRGEPLNRYVTLGVRGVYTPTW